MSTTTQTHGEGDDQVPKSLFATHEKVYPKSVAGKYRKLKWIALAVLLAIYYVVPWLRWDRGPTAPDQAVLVDLTGPRLYFFFIEIWPQEIYYLTGLLIMAAVGLFLATSLAGRIWCGYACPQTVWTDLYIWIERKIEGDRSERIRLDKSPLSGRKVLKKLYKHLAWLLVAFLTGGAWAMYFTDAPTLVVDLVKIPGTSQSFFSTPPPASALRSSRSTAITISSRCLNASHPRGSPLSRESGSSLTTRQTQSSCSARTQSRGSDGTSRSSTAGAGTPIVGTSASGMSLSISFLRAGSFGCRFGRPT
jgi:hypothetical protein